jgi:hypothetical protein
MVAAAADSYGGTSAADTVNQLTSDGYNVELNLDGDVPVSECTVTGTEDSQDGPSGAHRWPRGQLVTVSVDVTARQTTDR